MSLMLGRDLVVGRHRGFVRRVGPRAKARTGDSVDRPDVEARPSDFAAEVMWLAERSSRDTGTGFDAAGWPSSIWVLHAMFEHPADVSLTHHELREMRLEAGEVEPLIRRIGQPRRVHHVVTHDHLVREVRWPRPK
jgi:hypothetical protein